MIPQVDLFSFVFWKNSKTQTRHFEINWPLVQTLKYTMHLHKIRDILKVQIWFFSKRNIVWLLSKPLHFWWVLKSISKSATCFLLWKKQNASFPGPKIPRTKIYSGLSSLLILYLLCKTLYVSFFHPAI